MDNRTKLELTWVGKENRPRLEPRILLEDPERSYHAPRRVTDQDLFDNRLIFGDNLLALKALEQEFAGKIKCIYIDPPYNTRQTFAHYDDRVEHSLWLTLMRDRLEILRSLLTPDGSIWVHCNDVEQAYLKVMMDEVFGRKNFITTFIWKRVDGPNNNNIAVTPDHDYILCYSRNPKATRFKKKADWSLLDTYMRDENGRLFRDIPLKKFGRKSLRKDYPTMYFPITDPDGNQVYPIHADGREARWSYGKQRVEKMIAEGVIVWKQSTLSGATRWVPYTRKYAPDVPVRPHPTIWLDVKTTTHAKAHQRVLLPQVAPFDTPKPEQLLQRVIEIATDAGDWVLDSFAGSGTTGAVAQKMGRRWIMVELGEHCHTHIIPRLQKVVDGDDPGGITEAVGWRGGGGFRYFRLAPPLLERDQWGNLVIDKAYNAEMLAEAMCKHEGFTYAPSEEIFWQQGHSTERDFIYTTTQELGPAQLAYLSDEVGEERSLLVCCKAFRANPDDFPNLTIKKIPQAVLSRCEFGRDDYSLQVANLPAAPPSSWRAETLGSGVRGAPAPRDEEVPAPGWGRKKNTAMNNENTPSQYVLDLEGYTAATKN